MHGKTRKKIPFAAVNRFAFGMCLCMERVPLEQKVGKPVRPGQSTTERRRVIGMSSLKKAFEKKPVVFVAVLVSFLGALTWGFLSFKESLGGHSLYAAENPQEGGFGGVGLQIAKKEGTIVVVETVRGTPAQKAGVRPGDRIAEINGQPVGEDPNIEEIVGKLRGEPGTEVALTVKRGDETKTFTIKRARIRPPEPEFRVIERRGPVIRDWTPEEFPPFDEDWGFSWPGADNEAVKQYRDALRRLEEARRRLWQSLPGPQWDPRDPRVPRGIPRIPDWTPRFDRPAPTDLLHMDMDVTETDDAITIRCDMPGMQKDDIDISLTGNVLTVKGERKVEEEAKDDEGRVVRRERRVGSFARSFTVPENVKPEDVKTSYEDGVLTIIVPKEKPKPEKEDQPVRIKIGTI
jgi:HSP20 family protein